MTVLVHGAVQNGNTNRRCVVSDLSTLRDHNEELLALVSALRERIAYLEAEVARLEKVAANG